MSKELLETLDAMNNERPQVIKLKRRHFDMPQASACSTKEERLEWMRLCAERDRVSKFKNVAIAQTKAYYKCLESFSEMVDRRNNP